MLAESRDSSTTQISHLNAVSACVGVVVCLPVPLSGVPLRRGYYRHRSFYLTSVENPEPPKGSFFAAWSRSEYNGLHASPIERENLRRENLDFFLLLSFFLSFKSAFLIFLLSSFNHFPLSSLNTE